MFIRVSRVFSRFLIVAICSILAFSIQDAFAQQRLWNELTSQQQNLAEQLSAEAPPLADITAVIDPSGQIVDFIVDYTELLNAIKLAKEELSRAKDRLFAADVVLSIAQETGQKTEELQALRDKAKSNLDDAEAYLASLTRDLRILEKRKR